MLAELEAVRDEQGLVGEPVLARSYTWGQHLGGGVGGLLEVRMHDPDTGLITATYYAARDGNGNVTALVDADTGQAVAAYDYAAFGLPTSIDTLHAAAADASRFLFSTKYFDAEIGLYYYGYRYYCPETGRWISRDPIAEAGGLNLYAALRNQPPNTFDPYGLRDGFYYAENQMQACFYALAKFFGSICEFFVGGDTSSDQAIAANTGRLPEGGPGGVAGGVARTVSLRVIPFETNPSPLSRAGGEVGAQQCRILDPAQRLITGETVTGLEASRAWAAVDLSIDALTLTLPYLQKKAAIKNALSNPIQQPLTRGEVLRLQYSERFTDYLAGRAQGLTPTQAKLLMDSPSPVLNILADRSAAMRTVPAQLEAGAAHEARRLTELGATKNTMVFRPTPADIDSAAFKVIVGDAKYTPGGLPKGTIVNVTQGGLREFKGGTSVLESTYQLRLQTYHSLKEGLPYTIETTRPVNPALQSWLKRWGVTIEVLKDGL